VELRETIQRYADLCGVSANRWMEQCLEAMVQMCGAPMTDMVPVPKIVWQTQMWLSYMKSHPELQKEPNGDTAPTS
jgi:hypothetical protein